MEIIEFNHKTQRTVTDTRIVTLEEFIAILQTYKPKEIWCNMWSTKKPFLVITEYLGDDKILLFCNANSDLTPQESTMQQIYKSHRYGGLSDSHFVMPSVETEKA